LKVPYSSTQEEVATKNMRWKWVTKKMGKQMGRKGKRKRQHNLHLFA